MGRDVDLPSDHQLLEAERDPSQTCPGRGGRETIVPTPSWNRGFNQGQQFPERGPAILTPASSSNNTITDFGSQKGPPSNRLVKLRKL
jgi:hypothetical protein